MYTVGQGYKRLLRKLYCTV